MPVQHQPIEQISNVQWSGGQFAVVGTAVDTTREGPIGVFFSKNGKQWNSTKVDPNTDAPPSAVDEPAMTPRAPGLRFNYLTAMVGGSVPTADEEHPDAPDTRVIVAGGVRSDLINVEITNPDVAGGYRYDYQTKAILFFSSDGGKNWIPVDNPVTAPPGSLGVSVDVFVRYLAFDPEAKRFYADVQKSGKEGEGSTPFFERNLLLSTDGRAWSIETTERHDDPAPEWTSPFISKIKDIKNNGLTEVGTVSDSGSLMLSYSEVKPIADVTGGSFQFKKPFKIIKTTVDEGGEETTEERDLTEITVSDAAATAGFMGFTRAGGIFMIAGSLELADDYTGRDVIVYVSTDGGDTWQETMRDSTTFISSDPYADGGIGCAGCCGCGA